MEVERTTMHDQDILAAPRVDQLQETGGLPRRGVRSAGMGFDQAQVNRIFLPETYAEGVPYELFRELRTAAPVCWVEEPAVGEWPPGPGYWAVLRHADVKQVLRRPEDFSSHLGATQIRDPDTLADLDFARTMMLNQDPPDHSRLRRAVAAAFTPRALRELTAAIEARAAELIAAIRPLGEADFVPLAADLPVWTLARILGVPEQDRQLLVDWSTTSTRSPTSSTPEASPQPTSGSSCGASKPPSTRSTGPSTGWSAGDPQDPHRHRPLLSPHRLPLRPR
ncbi:hypothetical protein ACFVFS_19875 [Kitasatospora sp. NPDC057692]|uniref:hypothetical protein n=1 Tax=Kitasatospora sp. NPDC057692 TaxID=3346215 RepID=UPI0036C50C11